MDGLSNLRRKPRTDRRRMLSQKDNRRISNGVQRDGKRITEGYFFPSALLLTSFCHPFAILLRSHPLWIFDSVNMDWQRDGKRIVEG